MPIYPVLHQMKIPFLQVKIFELGSYQCHKFHQWQFFLKYGAIQDLNMEDSPLNGECTPAFHCKDEMSPSYSRQKVGVFIYLFIGYGYLQNGEDKDYC